MSGAVAKLRKLSARLSRRIGTASSRRRGSAQARPRRGLTPWLWALLAASVVVPLLLLTIASWLNFRLVQREARERVVVEASQMHEQALGAFKTYRLALDWIDDRIRGFDWDRIEHDPGVHRFLADIERLPEADDVWIADSAGQNRASGNFLAPAPGDISERGYRAAEQAPEGQILVGRAHVGRHAHELQFSVYRRRSAAGGVVGISADAIYFSKFYRTVFPGKGSSALLLRADGAVLAHYPVTAPLALPQDSRFLRLVAAAPDGGTFEAAIEPDRVERIYAYRRIEGYPVFVVFGLASRDVLAAWRRNLVNYSLFAVPGILALFGMTLLAAHQIQRHKIAAWRWQITARRLQREMDRRTLAEAELHQAQKMEALGQLTGGVAHDFNNLLTVVQGCLELLSGRQRDEAGQARVEMALRTIARGEKLTRQLLAFARRKPLELTSIDLNARLRGMAELLARTVGSGITVETDLATGLWPIEADATQLELAVINLAINARDAMPDGGRLVIRTFNRRTPISPPGKGGKFVVLEVADTGSGMTPEVLERAFEPFFTTKGAGKGTGLGLSMVYGFARQSGGSATIRSEPGRGTTVALNLPRGDRADEGEAGAPPGLPPGGPP